MLPLTYLFVPGDRPERFSKAIASGASRVVLDLEDAVTASGKDTARHLVAAALESSDLRACIRINGIESPWFEEDCRLLKLPGVVSVLLPKAESAEGIAAVRMASDHGVLVVPIIETGRGLAAATKVAQSPGVLQLAFGSVDFQQDLGIEADGLELLYARSQIVLSSRLADVVAPIDGVTLAVTDINQVRADALRARQMGFSGKLCIHPAQVAHVHQVFTPDAERLAWARGVLAAAAATTSGALTFEGKLVDKPVLDRAQAILNRVAQ